MKNDGTPIIPDGCWYRLIEDTLLDHCGYDRRRGRRRQDPAISEIRAARRCRGESRTPQRRRNSPPWLTQPVADDGSRVTAITPSGAAEDDARYAAAPSSFDRESALLRGTLVHRLMQSLPDIAPEFRAEAARRYLARSGKKLDQDRRDDIAAQVFAILDNPRIRSRSSRQAAARKCRSSGRLGTSPWSPDRSTGWW